MAFRVNQPISPAMQLALDERISKDLDSGKILVGNSGNRASDVYLSGDATIDNLGQLTIIANAIFTKIIASFNLVGGGSVANGDTLLQALGKLQNQINGVLGSDVFQGVWNANTNSPSLTSGIGVRGSYYIVNVAGVTNLNGITDWKNGDWAIFDGTQWRKVDNTDLVSSVNGQVGTVSLNTDNITEGLVNQYFSVVRVFNSTISGLILSNTAVANGDTLQTIIGKLQGQLNNKQGTITTGTTAQYFRGDFSLATFPTALSAFTNDANYISLTSILTGLASPTNNAISSADSLLLAFSKLQGQINYFKTNEQTTHTSGSTVTIANGNNFLSVNPSPKLAALAITMPSAPTNGDEIKIRFGGTISSGVVVTALTFVPNSGQTILGMASVVSAWVGEIYTLKYHSGTSSWAVERADLITVQVGNSASPSVFTNARIIPFQVTATANANGIGSIDISALGIITMYCKPLIWLERAAASAASAGFVEVTSSTNTAINFIAVEGNTVALAGQALEPIVGSVSINVLMIAI